MKNHFDIEVYITLGNLVVKNGHWVLFLIILEFHNRAARVSKRGSLCVHVSMRNSRIHLYTQTPPLAYARGSVVKSTIFAKG
jgi:hypothetical protein